MPERAFQQSTRSSNLADVLELVLDRGIVIAGDIKINLVEVELLTIQLRLVICSIDRAKEIGLDWWNQRVQAPGHERDALNSRTRDLEERLARLEDRLTQEREASRETEHPTRQQHELSREPQDSLTEPREGGSIDNNG